MQRGRRFAGVGLAGLVLGLMLGLAPALADPGPGDEVVFTAGTCDSPTTLAAHNTTDKTIHYLMRVDGKLVQDGTLAPDERVSREFTQPNHTSHFYRIRLGLNIDHVYFSDEGFTRLDCPDGERFKVTLCHRTDSNVNPYVKITVAVPSVRFEGHDGHNGPLWNPNLKAQGIKWGDIIPPFTAGEFVYPGKNWPEGLGIFENDCHVQTPTPPPPTTTPPPPPTTTPPPPCNNPPCTPTHTTGTPVCTNGDCRRHTADTGLPKWPLAAGAGLLIVGLPFTIWGRKKTEEV